MAVMADAEHEEKKIYIFTLTNQKDGLQMMKCFSTEMKAMEEAWQNFDFKYKMEKGIEWDEDDDKKTSKTLKTFEDYISFFNVKTTKDFIDMFSTLRKNGLINSNFYGPRCRDREWCEMDEWWNITCHIVH